MGIIPEAAKEYWEAAIGFLAGVFAIILAFQEKFSEISLELRFFFAWLVGASAVFCVIAVLRRNGKRMGVIALIAIFAICALTVALLRETANFHNVRILQRSNPGAANAATIEVQPPHSPVNLVIRLSTPQSGPMILEEVPGSWNKEDVVEWRIENESPYGVTLTLLNFKSPQVFGVWYRLSGNARALRIEASSNPAQVRILRDHQLEVFDKYFWIFGGLLCVAGLLCGSYLLFWSRPNKLS